MVQQIIICIISLSFFLLRSWDKVYIVLQGSRLSAYKDQKSFNSAPTVCFKNEAPADLRGGTCEIANDYTKKKHVFRLK